jgi:hypothetical protein
MGYAMKKLPEYSIKAQDEMKLCTNPVFKRLYQKTMESAALIKENHHRAVVHDLGGLGIWMMYKDTAFDDVFSYTLLELYKDKEFMADLERSVKKPEIWYVNVWHDVKANTQDKIAKGEITKYDLAVDEKTFVPGIQEREWQNKYFKQYADEVEKYLEKRNKIHRG